MELLSYLKDHVVYLDGAMGTSLQARGIAPGERSEVWNETHPDDIVEIHRSYIEAGSNIISTNTFGANRLHFTTAELETYISLAVAHAREAQRTADADHPTWVALDIGPLGRLLKPFGDYSFDDAVESFAQTVQIGVKNGVDLIFIETMNDCYETKAAVLAAKENADLPIFVSNSYDDNGRLMTGANPEAMIALLESMRVNAIGVNCSLGPKQLRSVVGEYVKYASIPVFFKPNAGLPQFIGGKNVYDLSAEEWAEEVADIMHSGVYIAGGCCGTDRSYIRSLVEKTQDLAVSPIEKKNYSWVSSYTHAVRFGSDPVLIAERINPNAIQELNQAMTEGNIARIVEEAKKEESEGAHVIDINAGLPKIDEPKLLTDMVVAVQAVVDLPIAIDTSDPAAMEAALRHHNGKALIDSVNGKESVMDAIFPLAVKYGGMIVALPIDENGIPKTAEERVEVCKKIMKRAAEYGIDKSELIFDPLLMTISTNDMAAMETLKAVKMLHAMGCFTSLGVSNVSFGLPCRPVVNATLYVMALESGLNTGIVNTGSQEIMDAYYAFRALHGIDSGSQNYIKYSQKKLKRMALNPSIYQQTAGQSVQEAFLTGRDSGGEDSQDELTPLQEAIVEGMEEEAFELTKVLLRTKDALDIVSEEIIPALDYVGAGYSAGDFFLPELIMSADAAQEAFVAIKAKMAESGQSGPTKCSVFIATVKGDLHDIGKNILKVLLDNYGFDVHDLGMDVEPDYIVEEVVRTHAPLVGLSALMTTSIPSMEETIRKLNEKAPWCRIAVGGAVVNQESADRMHADFYGRDAMDTVRYCDEINNTL